MEEVPNEPDEQGRTWHYCPGMTEERVCSDASHVEHKKRKAEVGDKVWWDYTLQRLTPKHMRPRTPGYDGPEGTEWPGGFAMYMDTPGMGQARRAAQDAEEKLIRDRRARG